MSLGGRNRRPASPLRRILPVLLGGLAVASFALGTARAQLQYDVLGSSALAVAAYEESKDRCTYNGKMGKALADIDAFLKRRADYQWDEAKRLGPDGLVGPRNVGRMQGASDCKIYGVLIGNIAAVYLNAANFDQEVFADFTRLSGGGGRSKSGELEASPKQPPLPGSAAGIIAEYNRQHPDFNRSADPGTGASTLRRLPPDSNSTTAPRSQPPPRQSAEPAYKEDLSAAPQQRGAIPAPPLTQAEPTADRTPGIACRAPGFCAVRPGPPIWICPQADGLALPTSEAKSAAKCLRISDNNAGEVISARESAVTLANLFGGKPPYQSVYYALAGDLVGVSVQPPPTPATRGWCRPETWCVTAGGTLFCRDSAAYDRVQTMPPGEPRRLAILAEPGCRIVIAGNLLKPRGLPAAGDAQKLVEVDHPVLQTGWASADAFPVVAFNTPLRDTPRLSDITISAGKAPSFAAISIGGQGTNAASGVFRAGSNERMDFCKEYWREERTEAFASCRSAPDATLTVRANCYERRVTVDDRRYELVKRSADATRNIHIDRNRQWLFRNLEDGQWLDGTTASGEVKVESAFNALCPGVSSDASFGLVYRDPRAEFPRELRGRWFDDRRACADPQRHAPEYDEHAVMVISSQERGGTRDFEFPQRVDVVRQTGPRSWQIDGSHRIDALDVPEVFGTATYTLTPVGLELKRDGVVSVWTRCQ